MNDFLNQVWLDNPVKDYIIVAGVIVFVWLLKTYISRYLAGALFTIVHRIWKTVDSNSFTNLVAKPLSFFLIILVSIIALHKLVFPEVLNVEVYKYTIKDIIHWGVTIILIVSFIWLLLRIIDFIATILERKANLTIDHSDNQLIVFFKDFFKVILVIIGIMMVLNYAFNLNVGSLLTGLSIVGAAIALSLRESIENLIASFIIFFDKPFTTGDLVKVQNVTGSVEKIGLRSTRIRTDQKTFVTVPNKQMVDSILDNLSLRTQRRGDLRLELSLGTSTGKLDLIIETLKKFLERKEIEDSNIILSEITTNAIVVTSDYYTAPITMKEFNFVKQEVNMQTLKMLEEMEVELAGSSSSIRIVGDPR